MNRKCFSSSLQKRQGANSPVSSVPQWEHRTRVTVVLWPHTGHWAGA